jgi:hypothetical protein
MIDPSPDFQKLKNICFVIKENHAKTEIKGTGFFIDTSGLALTAWHVIKGLDRRDIAIRFEKRTNRAERPQIIKTQASVKDYSEKDDIAILSVKDITLAEDDIVPVSTNFFPGDEILVAGYQKQDYSLGLQLLEMQIEKYEGIRSVRLEGESEYTKRIVLIPKDTKDVVLKGTSGGPVTDRETNSIIGVVHSTRAVEGLEGNKGDGYASAFLDLPRELDAVTLRLTKRPRRDGLIVGRKAPGELRPERELTWEADVNTFGFYFNVVNVHVHIYPDGHSDNVWSYELVVTDQRHGIMSQEHFGGTEVGRITKFRFKSSTSPMNRIKCSWVPDELQCTARVFRGLVRFAPPLQMYDRVVYKFKYKTWNGIVLTEKQRLATLSKGHGTGFLLPFGKETVSMHVKYPSRKLKIRVDFPLGYPATPECVAYQLADRNFTDQNPESIKIPPDTFTYAKDTAVLEVGMPLRDYRYAIAWKVPDRVPKVGNMSGSDDVIKSVLGKGSGQGKEQDHRSYDAFIIHEFRTGNKLALSIKDGLEHFGITTFVAPQDVPTGANEESTRQSALKDAQEIFVLITNGLLVRPGEAKHEIKAVLGAGQGARIKPYRKKGIGSKEAVEFLMKMGITFKKQCPEFDDADGLVDDILSRKRRGEYFTPAQVITEKMKTSADQARLDDAKVQIETPLKDIKADLLNMSIRQREVATRKAEGSCPPMLAAQIQDTCFAFWGTDGSYFTKVFDGVLRQDFDPLIAFFKTFGDILDANGYGLKIELESIEPYKFSRLDLAQKRLSLHTTKEKNAIIQSNINRICTATYGLNSAILLRGILRSLPKTDDTRNLTLIVLALLEGIETQTENFLNDGLVNLENVWTINISDLLTIDTTQIQVLSTLLSNLKNQDQIERQLNQDGPNQQKIREQVEILNSKINLPEIFSFFSFGFRPVPKRLNSFSFGQSRYGEKDYPTVIVDQNYKVASVKIGMERQSLGQAGTFQEPQEPLYSHLKTSKFFAVLTDITKWKKGVGQYFEKCYDFLKVAVSEVKVQDGFPYDSDEVERLNEKPGYYKDFFTTACADAIEIANDKPPVTDLGDLSSELTGRGFEIANGKLRIADHGYWIPPERNAYNLWVLSRYINGTSSIYVASAKEEAYEHLHEHQELAISLSENPKAKQIAKFRQGLEQMMKKIQNQLITFRDTYPLPGHCNLGC